jgi:micrococcal nuclease
MVRAGLAMVSIYDGNEARAADLVRAQREARAEKRGMWQREKKGDEKVYLADKTRWRFHRPSCEWAKKIPADKLVKYDSKGAAFDDGRNPCSTCKP